MKFSDFSISGELLRAIEDMGFEEPTPIQALAIPKLLNGEDVTGQAQTGTGKTAAFGLPTIEGIKPEINGVQAIVLSPTRELTIQTAEEFSKLLKYMPEITVLPIYGGQPIDRQIRTLRKGVQIVIGTPGRVMDHLNRGTLKLDHVHMVVLDEADQMLDMGFREDIETILGHVPKDRQTTLFSATMPRPILEISKRFQTNPETVRVTHRELTVPQIDQTYIELRERDKLEILSRLIDIYNPELALIFCNTKRRVDELAGSLRARGYLAEGLHGDMKQMQRDRVMAKFRSGMIDILIATDVAARGIDVDDVDTVFNYDVPQDVEYYVHRIGRTGRAGRSGRSITFVAPKEIYKLRSIQRYAKITISRIPVPSLSDVEETKIKNYINKIRSTINEGDIEKYLPIVEQIMEDEHSSLEIAAALMKLQLDKVDKQEQDTKSETTSFGDTGAEPGMVRLEINIGRSNRISPGDFVGAIAGETNVPGKAIGAIRIQDDRSFVEVPIEFADEVIKVMNEKAIKGNRVMVKPANQYNR